MLRYVDMSNASLISTHCTPIYFLNDEYVRAPFQYEDNLLCRGFQWQNKTVMRPSYLYNGNSHTDKTSVYWDCFQHLQIIPLQLYCLNRHQTILHTFLNFFTNLTLSGEPHLYKQLPNGQLLSDLCKMCNLEANLWKIWIGDHRFLTYIFKWERLNTAGQSHTVSIDHWVDPLYND